MSYKGVARKWLIPISQKVALGALQPEPTRLLCVTYRGLIWQGDCSTTGRFRLRHFEPEKSWLSGHTAQEGTLEGLNIMQSKWLSALLVIACVALLSGAGFASTCPGGYYNQYLGSGFSCSIDDKTFSNFQYTSSSNPPGFQLPAGSIAVTPITTPGNPGLQFSGGWEASTTTGVLSMDSLFQFTVNVNPGGAKITDLSLSIGGVGFMGTGQVVVDETVCLGATFPSCTGGTVDYLRVARDSNENIIYDQINFAGVSEVDVEKDVLINAGTNGSASLSLVTNQFSEGTTPEPASILLFGSGALALAGVLRRKLNH